MPDLGRTQPEDPERKGRELMSSPLDGRIRKLAREEAIALASAPPAAANSVDPDRVAALEVEVADLRGAVKTLYTRLDAMESATGQTDQEARPAARRTRKPSE